MKNGNLKSLRKRLDKAEMHLKVESVTLQLDNGQKLRIFRRDVLKLCTAGMRRRYAGD
jgi:hypothetical protein